jgi:Putative auto-transporter adhesin, head GIN domain
MTRLLSHYSRGLAALLLFAAVPAFPQPGSSRLDEGMPIPAAWSPTEAFDEVVLSGADDVVVSQGDRWRIRASGYRAVLDDLRFVVEDGELLIGRRWRRTPAAGTARIEVSAPAIRRAHLAGSGRLTISDLDGETGRAAVSGSGELAIERVHVGRLAAKIAGSGDMRLHASGRVSASIVGSGNAAVTGTRDCTQNRMGSGRLTCTQ